jgi:secreted trypsin-like serine protease
MYRILLLLGVVFAVACESKNQKVVALNNDTNIIGGTEVADKSELASSIVSVYDIKENAICTGTLIAENYVVTAAHCGTTKSQNIKILFGVDVDESLAIREVDVRALYVHDVNRIYVHPKYNPNSTKETDIYDIAVVKFQGSLPPGYKPAKMLNDTSLLKKSTMVTVAGYGVSNVYLEIVDPKKVKNLKDAIQNGEITCDENLRNCSRIEMSGDGILRTTQAPIAAVYDTEVVLDESKGHGTCNGDSGGPAFIEKNGEYLLFGVTSRGSEACNDIGIYTNAVAYLDWISSILKK